MGGFQVDSDTLDDVASRFAQLATELAAAAFRTAATDAELGGADVGDALRAFDERWQQAETRLEAHLNSVSEYFSVAAQDYREADEQVAEHARPGGAPLWGGTP